MADIPTTARVVIIGGGAVGVSALYHLAKRGVKALGIDRFPPGHDRGSSHGATRIIRLAYMEHPDYVPLLRRSYELPMARPSRHCSIVPSVTICRWSPSRRKSSDSAFPVSWFRPRWP